MLTRKKLYLYLRSRKTSGEWGEWVEGLLGWSLSQSDTYSTLGIGEDIAEKTILHAKTVEL